jgi:hypothetical protein
VAITHLLYSTDEGKTWTEDMPILKDGNLKFMLKVEWTGKESRPVVWGTVNSKISSDKDFASALNGGPRETIDGTGFVQTANVTWFTKGNQPFVFAVDLGERKEGTMGQRNKWDKGKRYFVDAPLPATAAYNPGTYRFKLDVYYHLKKGVEGSPYKDSRLVPDSRTFDVLINK